MSDLRAKKVSEFKCLDKAVEHYLSRPTIAAICGSTRFFDDYMDVGRQLTFLGWTVLSVGSYGHSFHKDISIELPLEKVKILHFWKIEQADAIVVVNPRDHLGHSTKKEIQFATERGKSIIEYHGNAAGGGYFKGIDLKPRFTQTLDDFIAGSVWQDFVKKHPDFC